MRPDGRPIVRSYCASFSIAQRCAALPSIEPEVRCRAERSQKLRCLEFCECIGTEIAGASLKQELIHAIWNMKSTEIYLIESLMVYYRR